MSQWVARARELMTDASSGSDETSLQDLLAQAEQMPIAMDETEYLRYVRDL